MLWLLYTYQQFWEKLNNPDFNAIEFDGFGKLAGLNGLVLTPKGCIEITNVIQKNLNTEKLIKWIATNARISNYFWLKTTENERYHL